MIVEIKDSTKKEQITLEILRDLPEWFGIESSIIEYSEAVKEMPFFVYKIGDEAAGFIALKCCTSCDMHVLGIKKHYHRQGYGKEMVDYAENYARSLGMKYMTVKTLSDDHPDENYKKTRRFYESLGYDHLEVFPTLWGEENPCLYMIKVL